MIRQPPILRGTQTQQIQQLRAYLFQISRELETTLRTLGVEDQKTRRILSGAADAETKAEMQSGLTNLKSLILKTADLVQVEMDKLETELRSSYVASSDFGTYQEDIIQRITAMDGQIEQAIADTVTISDTLHGVSTEFDAYRIETQGYIRQGIVGYANAVPIIGIAIGQDIAVTGETETVDEVEYQVIDTSSNMSVWTPEKLSFYINGAETAYFSNGALYVGNVIVTGKLYLGEHGWEISYQNGFAIKYTGS